MANHPITKNRHLSQTMIVSKDTGLANTLKQCLNQLGFQNVSSTNNHGQGLERLKGRNFNLVFFDAVATNLSAVDFVKVVRQIDGDAFLIALSAKPSIDDVFELLRVGARGFVVLPFAINVLEEVILKAVNGPPFSEAVLEATDRNTALANIVLNDLDSLTHCLRHRKTFPESVTPIEPYKTALFDSMKLAKTFAKGGDQNLLLKLCEACIQRATTGSTRLGRMRRRLQKMRVKQKTGTHKNPRMQKSA